MAVLKISFTMLALTFLLSVFSEAYPFCDNKELVVGGNETSWRIPPSNNSFNEWRKKIDEFIVGDTLTFKYDNKTDSVFEVNRSDYLVCKTSKPIKEYRDGNTAVELDRWGNYYFISGAEGHCEKGQKLGIYAEVDGVCYWRTREFPTPPEAIADEEEEDHDGDKKDHYIYDHSVYDYQDYDYYLDENHAVQIEIMKSRLFGRKA